MSCGQQCRGLTAMQVNYYAKRWTIEPNFRDTKDLRFGWYWSTGRITPRSGQR